MKHRNIITLILLVLLASIMPLSAQEETTCEEGATLIVHDLGETCVPADAERIVTIENSITEAVVTLGVQPVGVADLDLYNHVVQLPATEAIDVGTRQEPNLEVIATLEPDLIVAASWRISEVYDELSAIAPTITFEGSSSMAIMEDYFTTIATALDREEAAQQILADMYAYFDDAAAAVEAADIDPQIVLSYTWYADDQATIRLFTDNSFPIETLALVGFENTWQGEDNPNGFNVVGIESMGDIETSNFFFITDPDSAAFYEESELWNALPYVESGDSHRMDDSLWLYGGPISAQRLVEAVLAALEIEVMGATEMASCEDGFRLFEHENIVGGAVCVPETAQRIVTLDPFYSLQMNLEMELPVIGAASYNGGFDFPEAIPAEALEGLEVVGAFEAPNLEAITTLNPDLIIGDAHFQEAQYDLFSEIAPTILIGGAGWKGWYEIIGAAAGTPERAEAAFDAYNARIAALQEMIPEDVTVSFLRIVPDGFQLYREAPNAYAPVAVMTEAGVIRPDFESGSDDESFARLDYEGVSNIEGDILLYVISGEADSASQLEEDTASNPIWQLLPAVAADQAYRVDAAHWMNFGGLRSAHAALDDLFTFVVGVDPAEASPNPFMIGE